MATIVTLKQNGIITIGGAMVGVWFFEDVWAKEGKTDIYGHRLVHGFYHAHLITGEDVWQYEKREIRSAVENRWKELLKAANTLTEEQKWCNINNAK